MRNRGGKALALLVLGCLSVAQADYSQEQKPAPEGYSAAAIGTGGTVGGKSIPFDFRVTRYTTDEELAKFVALVKDKGTNALRRALDKENVGRINAAGRVGNQVAVARKRQQGPETVITLVTARYTPFIELYQSNRSTDYPFGFLQVRLNDKGEGTGQIMAAARIRFDKKKDQYEIESYGNQYIKAVNIRPWKQKAKAEE
jgi:hypothetical protein